VCSTRAINKLFTSDYFRLVCCTVQHANTEGECVASRQPVRLLGQVRNAREESVDGRRGHQRRMHVYTEKSQRNLHQRP